jgi:hypothetical protein
MKCFLTGISVTNQGGVISGCKERILVFLKKYNSIFITKLSLVVKKCAVKP